jgi:O-succinylhomoserine sulfhydrylase
MATNIDLNGFDELVWHPETLGVRAGNQMTEFGENSEALFLNSSFRFKSAAQVPRVLAARSLVISILVLPIQR